MSSGSVSPQLEACTLPQAGQLEAEVGCPVPMVQVTLTLTTTSPLTRSVLLTTACYLPLTAHSRVRVSVAAVPPVTVSRPTLTFASLTGTHTTQVLLSTYYGAE